MSLSAFYRNNYGKRVDCKAAEVAGRWTNLIACLLPRGQPVEILDVGCGDMAIGKAIAARVGRNHPYMLTGMEFSDAAVMANLEKGSICLAGDISGEIDRSKQYDVVLFLDVLEHLVDTDAAMRNLWHLVKKDGLLILSTPNLAAWYNRIFLAMGMQPHGTEVSFENRNFGNPVAARLIEGGTAGHLRVFAWRALCEFLRYHGFEIAAMRGISNHKFDVISKLFSVVAPSLCGDLVLVCRPVLDAQLRRK